MDPRFAHVYGALRRAYGPQRWWPVTPPGGVRPEYTGGPRSARQRFEVAAGAILTQNTAWTNASRAIESLTRAGAMSPEKIRSMSERALARAIRPAGYYNQKAKRLRVLAEFFLSGRKPTREGLLALSGVGPETADSIMLYAFDAPLFVVDAYTRRLFGRLGLIGADDSYEEIRSAFERNLRRSTALYAEYHALIVAHAKSVCKKSPNCKNCLLNNHCVLYLGRIDAG